jgi:hypothetical protein
MPKEIRLFFIYLTFVTFIIFLWVYIWYFYFYFLCFTFIFYCLTFIHFSITLFYIVFFNCILAACTAEPCISRLGGSMERIFSNWTFFYNFVREHLMMACLGAETCSVE